MTPSSPSSNRNAALGAHDDSGDAFASHLSKLTAHLSAHASSLSTLPTIASPASVSRALTLLPSHLPAQGLGLDSTMSLLHECLLPALAPGHAGPRYFGFVTGGVLPVAALADHYVTAYDQNVQVHLPDQTISTVVEHYAVLMLLDLLGMPRDKFTGTITTGATASNILGLLCAREYIFSTASDSACPSSSPTYSVAEHGFPTTAGAAPFRILSAWPHASVRKAAAVVGGGRANVVDVGRKGQRKVDDSAEAEPQDGWEWEFDLRRLEDELKRAKREGARCAVVVGFGEVNTGALSTLVPAIRALCDAYSSWLHIDAAFGAFAALMSKYSWVSEHLSMADSVTSDAHKWLNVPYDAGIFLVRRATTTLAGDAAPSHSSLLEAVLGSGAGPAPSYLSSNVSPLPSSTAENSDDAVSDPDGHRHLLTSLRALPSPLNINLENSRRFRALPIFAALVDRGKEGYSEIVRRNCEFASKVARWMEGRGEDSGGEGWYEVLGRPSGWEGAWPPLNVLLFRAARTRKPGAVPEAYLDPNTGHLELAHAINATRRMYVTPSSDARGRGAVRLAVSNWDTGRDRTKSGGAGAVDDWTEVRKALTEVMAGGAHR